MGESRTLNLDAVSNEQLATEIVRRYSRDHQCTLDEFRFQWCVEQIGERPWKHCNEFAFTAARYLVSEVSRLHPEWMEKAAIMREEAVE